jgi:D-cysteine desulfhydrase
MADRTDSALARWFPNLGTQLPRLSFATLPSPVVRLERVGPLRAVWVKRDDVAGTAYAGNKPRKLEFLLADAQRRGHRSVMTFGGIGTHHGLATTVCAARAGMRTHLVLVPQPLTPAVQRTLLLHHALGAQLHDAPTIGRAVAVGLRLLAAGAIRGDRPAVIPTGGTSVLGTLGYVDAALELAEQIVNEELPEPGTIFVALGSGGTVAGLTLGCRLAGLNTRVVGVLTTDLLPPSPARLARLARHTLARLRRVDPSVPPVSIGPQDFPRLTDQLGPGYGATTPAADAATAIAAQHGLQLDGTYTGKAFAALLAHGASPPHDRAPILFWHTYSAVDPGAALTRWPKPHELPPAFRRYFPA